HRCECGLELAEFVVHFNAQRLKCAGGGVDAMDAFGVGAPADIREVFGCAQPALFNRAFGLAGDAARMPLFTVPPDHTRNFVFRRALQEVQGGWTPARVHSHVQGSSMSEAETAL